MKNYLLLVSHSFLAFVKPFTKQMLFVVKLLVRLHKYVSLHLEFVTSQDGAFLRNLFKNITN
jgi:hypothetical protein